MPKYRDTYFLCKYKINESNFSNLSDANITRLMYIATYIGDDGYLIKLTGKNEEGFVPIHMKELKKMLSFKKATKETFLKELIENNYLWEENSKVYLNNELFISNKIADKIIKSDKNKVTIFEFKKSVIRSLIKNIPTSKYAVLGKIFKLPAFVNKINYYICYNQEEKDIDNIKFMTSSEMFNSIGYAYNPSAVTRNWKDINLFNICDETIVFKDIEIINNKEINVLKLNPLFAKIIFKKSVTTGEMKVQEYLNNKKIDYITQYKFEDCRLERELRFDFFLPERNVCIEYQGEQHYRPVKFGGCSLQEAVKNYKEGVERDRIKKKYCFENDINLICIPYWEYDNINTFLGDKLNLKEVEVLGMFF